MLDVMAIGLTQICLIHLFLDGRGRGVATISNMFVSTISDKRTLSAETEWSVLSKTVPNYFHYNSLQFSLSKFWARVRISAPSSCQRGMSDFTGDGKANETTMALSDYEEVVCILLTFVTSFLSLSVFC